MAVKLQNLHTHTVFGDGQNTAEEMVRSGELLAIIRTCLPDFH